MSNMVDGCCLCKWRGFVQPILEVGRMKKNILPHTVTPVMLLPQQQAKTEEVRGQPRTQTYHCFGIRTGEAWKCVLVRFKEGDQ